MTVADFERVVLTQRPAKALWEPVTDYSFEARAVVEGDHPRLILETFTPERVLDVGCGPGHLVELLNRHAGYKIAIGADVQPEAEYGLDISQPGASLWLRSDLVICREVLEHLTLREIRQAVTNLCGLSTRYVYGTTRFSSESEVFRVETHDDLDPTHITLASKDLLKLLFHLEGFRWRGDLATRMDWKSYSRTFVFERAV